MAELILHDVRWCPEHWRPFLVLSTPTQDQYLAVAISVEDAQAMAPMPRGDDRTRAYAMLVAALAGLGAQLKAVELGFGPGGTLHASLHIEDPRQALTLPVHFADGLILAHRSRLPLWIADEELARVPISAPPPLHRTPAPPAGGTPRPPEPFREVVASLDLDGLAGNGAAPETS